MNDEIDLEALQENIDETLIDQEEIVEVEEKAEEKVEEKIEEDFDLDKALDSFEPIALEGKITEDEAKEKATERGWREDGEDKYGHQISAIEFLERTPLFHKMNLMRGDIDAVKAQNKKLIDQSKLVAKKSIEDNRKLVDDFEKEKAELLSGTYLDEDQIARVKKIDKEISDVSTNDDVVTNDYELHKGEFMENNEWYETNRPMTALADKLGFDYISDHKSKNDGAMPDPEDLFQHVLDEVKKDFPDMGKERRTTRVASRQNRTVVKQNKSKKTLNDIPEDQRAVARMVMESADLTEEEYLKTYEA